MDLGKLKWPLIIAAVVLVFWLASNGGVNYMVSKFTTAVPGQDQERDRLDEAGLSRFGDYLMYTFQFDKAASVLELAVDRYGPLGANYWYNLYRLSKCYDRLKRYRESYDILTMLVDNDASQFDKRVPDSQIMRVTATRLQEVQGL
ncbi:MAG: hypothetical protein H3C30_09385 [Candidatus Hydrogenedentes bacterium]|nr:hypothetical protein [Candidatus Hydrogenedentota bacterium]